MRTARSSSRPIRGVSTKPPPGADTPREQTPLPPC